MLFRSPLAAVSCSADILALIKTFNEKSAWQQLGLRHPFEIRIALETAPLMYLYDPIEQKKVFTGNLMTKTARIEPVTQANNVYCGMGTFLSCLAHPEVLQQWDFHFLGVLSLSKSYGGEALFCIKRKGL